MTSQASIGASTQAPLSGRAGLEEMERERKQRRCRRKRTNFTAEMRAYLMKEFKKNPHVDSVRLARMTQELGLDVDVIKVWFKNQRAAVKADKA